MESQQSDLLQNQNISEALFDENSKQFIEMLIRENVKEAPLWLDEAILKKFDAEIKNAKKKKEVKGFFGDIKDYLEESDEKEKLSYQEEVQKCLEILYNSENCKELYSVLNLYCQYKAPKITLIQKISKEQRLIQDFQEISQILPLIDEKFQISHFMTIYEISQSQSDQFEIEKEFQNSGKIIGKKLIVLLFDCIKRKVNFNQVILMFSKLNRDCKVTSQILFTYLYLHSDPKLRIFLFISCSQYMALPLSLLNPWDIDSKTQIPKRIYFEELVYVFEKYNSVFQFKFLSNQENQNVQNCTKIINQLFGKNFQAHSSSSMVNEGLVEIQFDNNCSHVQYLTVADAHGQLESEIIENFSSLFEILIIHTDKVLDENIKLQELVKKINYQKQVKLIMIIVHSNNITKDEKPTQINPNTVQIKEQKATFQNNMDNFIDQCLRTQQKYLKNNIKSFLQDPKKRLDNKQEYLKFLEQNNYQLNMQKHNNSLFILGRLIDLIIRQEDFTSLDFLPMVQYSQERSSCENIFQYESLNLTEQQNNECEEKYKDLKSKMSNQSLTPLSKEFFQVIVQDLQLETLPILSLYVKGYLQTIKNPLEERIARAQEQLSLSTSQQKDLLEIEIKELKKKINQKMLSQEYLIREIYELSIYSQENRSFSEKQKILTSQLYRDCQPLEIINGETNKFVSNIYERIFKENKKEEVIIISVVGVQSAGKSLLLNFLFGTQFHSSAARCTKGVYATIIQFQTQDGKQKKILLLDTEGIQSQEKNDPQFDRKIIFFILSVSHVILLCNKQEMNKDMGEILKLVADQLVNAKQRNIHSPKVYIILNMLSESSHQIRIEAVRQLQSDLAIIQSRNNENLNKTLQINLDNVFTLQFAFERKNFKLYMEDNKTQTNSVNVPQLEFQNEIYELRKAILDNFAQYSQLSLHDWFEFAQENWKFTNTLRALRNFVNVQQIQEEQLIKEIINKLIYKYYIQGWKNEIKSQIDNQFKQTKEKFSGGQSISLNIIQNSIQTYIDDIYEKISKEFLQNFRNDCLLKRISDLIIENSLISIKRENYQYKYRAQAYSLKLSSEFYAQKFKDVGDSTLQRKIKEYFKQDKLFTRKSAEKIFEDEAWPEVLRKGKSILESEDQTKQRNTQFVGHQFMQVITIQNQEIENYCIQNFQLSNDLYEFYQGLLKKHFNKQQILMYTGDQKSPNFQNILQFLGQEKQYLTNLPNNIYEKKNLYKYYQWKKLLQDCVNFEKLSQDINECFEYQDEEVENIQFIQREENKEKKIKTINLKNKQKVIQIIHKLKQELDKLGIELQADYQQFINTNKNVLLQQNDGNYYNIILKNTQIILSQYSNIKIKSGPPTYSDISSNQFEYLIFEKNQPEMQQWVYHQQDYYLQSFTYNDKNNNQFKFIDEKEEYTVTSEMLKSFNEKERINLDFYFNHLANSKSTYASTKERKSSIKYFFDQLNWKLVLQQIDECIIKNLLKIQSDNGTEIQSLKSIIQILIKKDDQSIELKKKFNELEPKYSKDIIKGVKHIISKINEELEKFCLTISEVGMNLIYLIAQAGTFGLVYNLDLIKQIEPLKNIEKKQQIEKKIFIAKLMMNNNEIDKLLGEKLAQGYSDKCYQNCKEHIIEKFSDQIDSISEQFENIQLVNKLEQKCLEINQKIKNNQNYQLNESDQQSLNELIELKINPRQLLESKFKSEFNKLNFNLIKDQMAKFQDRFNPLLQIFINYLKKFLKLLEQKEINQTPANILFVLDQDSQTKLNIQQHDTQFQEYQKLALLNYFKSILRQEEFKNQEFQNGEVKLKISDDISVPVYTDIHDYEKFDRQHQEIVNSILLENDLITNLGSFVNYVIMNLENFIIKPYDSDQIQPKQNQLYEMKEEDLLAKCKNKLMKKFLGCLFHCPLCRKQCDIDHQDTFQGVNDEKHGCQSGHQFQAFGGSKIQENNNALLYSCDELKDNQIIKHGGQKLQWKSFKKDEFKEWIFDSADEEKVMINREKNVIIWNLIGQNLCTRFNQEGKNVNFHEAQLVLQQQLDKTHYIFMLDASSSMRYNDFWNFLGYYTVGFITSTFNIIPWDELMSKFKGFLKTLEYDDNHKENSKISLITYEQSSEIKFEEEIPDSQLLSKIKYKGGKANFDNALLDAYKICKKNHDQYQNIVLYLLSDGDGDYNGSGIQNFVQYQTIMEKTKLFAIAFGNNANTKILKQMADQLPDSRGQMIQALDTQQLKNSFEMIIPNIYKQ